MYICKWKMFTKLEQQCSNYSSCQHLFLHFCCGWCACLYRYYTSPDALSCSFRKPQLWGSGMPGKRTWHLCAICRIHLPGVPQSCTKVKQKFAFGLRITDRQVFASWRSLYYCKTLKKYWNKDKLRRTNKSEIKKKGKVQKRTILLLLLLLLNKVRWFFVFVRN